jgi:hypothetical protein
MQEFRARIARFSSTRLTFGLAALFVLSVTSSGKAVVESRRFQDPTRKLTLALADTGWDFFPTEDSASEKAATDIKLQFIARGPVIAQKGIQPTLTMRVDTGNWSSARLYAAKWLKEYPKFGYELQMSREARFGTLDGFEMELQANDTNRRVRQFVVARPSEVWVFTCSSDKENFDAAWSACRKILSTAKAQTAVIQRQ